MTLVSVASDVGHGFFNELATKDMKHRVRVAITERADDGFTAPRPMGGWPPMVPEQNPGNLDSRGNNSKKRLTSIVPASDLGTCVLLMVLPEVSFPAIK